MSDWHDYADRQFQDAQRSYERREPDYGGDDYYDDLVAAIKAFDEGRNLECWPLCSFGGKDADLDPEGCTGIKEIVEADEDSVWLHVGGHKAIGNPMEWWIDMPRWARFRLEEEVGDLVSCSDFFSDCDCSSFDFSFKEDRLRVDLIIDEETGDYDIAASAKACVGAALLACEAFEQDMRELDRQVDEIYRRASKEWEGYRSEECE